VYAAFDFIKGRIHLSIYLSEADAQEILVKLRRGLQAAVLPALTGLIESRLHAIFSGAAHGHVRLLHAALPPEVSRGHAFRRLPQAAQQVWARRLSEWVAERMAHFLVHRQNEFSHAIEDPADGVTISAVLQSPPGLATLGNVLAGKPATFDARALLMQKPHLTIRVTSGFHRHYDAQS